MSQRHIEEDVLTKASKWCIKPVSPNQKIVLEEAKKENLFLKAAAFFARNRRMPIKIRWLLRAAYYNYRKHRRPMKLELMKRKMSQSSPEFKRK